MLSKLLEHPSNGLYMLLAFAFGIDENVIKIYYHKNVKFLCQDLVDITLKRGRCVGQSKRHDLVFKVAIAGFEGRFPFITFSDSHLMVSISQIKLGEKLSST